MDFAVPPDHRTKLNESEKRDIYQDLAREIKKQQLWNIKVTVIPTVIRSLGIIPNGLLKGLKDLEIRGLVGTIQITSLLRSTRNLRKPRKLKESFSHPNSCEKPSANGGVKNS